ncbi:MAG: helix-turn-helix transcriptional regulator [Prolixibacteraceae bacterium]|jgi:transcriptional regulator with XRE-family HTH domain|nr:helix-turn-helix transcriptional regulator [Prolixibacteraceae bacterium]
MEEKIRQIAERLKGLREVLDVSISDAAGTCNITEDEYRRYESGKTDIPVSILLLPASKNLNQLRCT